MLTLYAFSNPKQNLISLNEEFQIEHIYAVSRNIKEHGLNDDKSIEKLGNKSLLEKDINIKASDYRFEDKKPYYYGTIQRRSKKEAKKTNIIDLLDIADNNIDFTEKNIIDRNKEIEDKFISYLRKQNLIKD